MKSKNSGFTLTEVLVAVVIGVLSIAAAFASYGYFNKSGKKSEILSALPLYQPPIVPHAVVWP